MNKINETPTWVADIYKLTTETPVLGADADDQADDIGPSNIQAQQLAKRTLYLKYTLEGIQAGENPYPTVAAAQAAINNGTIPLNSIFTVRGSTADKWVLEYQNINSQVTPVLDENGNQRSLATNDFVSRVNQLAQALQSEAHYRVKSVAYEADAYSGNCEIDGSLLYADMRSINLVIPTTNQTTSPTLAINGGNNRAIRGPGGQAINPGELAAGTIYSLQWHSGALQWRILSYPTDHQKVLSGYQGATTVDGTENAITLSINGVVANATSIYFLATKTNTAATTVTVTDISGAVSTRQILKEGNSPLSAGDITINNPVLMIYRGAPQNNWVLIASGGVATTLAQRLNALEGTANYSLTSPAMLNDAYTANCVSIGSALYNDNRIVTIRIPASNTTRLPTLSINGATARAIKAANGSDLSPNDLVSGYLYQFSWHGGSSQWRVMGYPADRVKYLTAPQKAIVTSNTSSPNAIALTIPGILGDGTELSFEPLVTNTGAVTLTITDMTGYTQTRTLLKGANTPLTGGELKYANIAKVQWRGSPVFNFKIMFSGDPAGDITNLRNDIANLKGAVGDPLAILNSKIIDAPFGSVVFTNGEKVVTKNRIICTSIGSSVGVGAGSSDGSLYAPNAQFVSALKEQMKNYGEFEIINDNQCIPTQALQQFEAQLKNSPYTTSDFLLIVGGMNDAPVGNFNTGRTFPGQRTTLERLVDLGKARGAIVIICTTPHHNVEDSMTAPVVPGDNPLYWPVRTMSVIGDYAFDAVNRTIYGTYFASTTYGGHILKPGHSLKVESGVNFGTYTIERISDDRLTITVAEPIAESSRYSTTVRHVNLNSIIEDILYPPPSTSVVTKDWTGAGVMTAGDIRFSMVNNMQRSVAREKSCYLADCEWASFRYAVEPLGWSSLYKAPNYNHPTDFGYTVTFGIPLKHAALELSSLVFMTRNFGRNL